MIDQSFGNIIDESNEMDSKSFRLSGITDRAVGKKHWHKSKNSKQGKVSLQALENNRQLAIMKVELKVSAIWDIIEKKVVNKLRNVFQQVRRVDSPVISLVTTKHTKNIIKSMVQKIDGVLSDKTTLLLSSALLLISLNCIKRRMTNNSITYEMNYQTSTRNEKATQNKILRVNSRLDEDSHMTAEKTNRTLKKKKQRIEKQVTDFYQEMDNLLSAHQSILNSK